MKSIFFLVGNYGVGKSTLINENIISKEGIFIEIKENVHVLGSSLSGADSLSNRTKHEVMNEVIKNKDKNIIITGNYYCQYKDFEILAPYFKLVLIYLKTSFENNSIRIEARGSMINIKTYNEKLKSHISLIKKTKRISKLIIVDNNRTKEDVKKEFYNIIENEKN